MSNKFLHLEYILVMLIMISHGPVPPTLASTLILYMFTSSFFNCTKCTLYSCSLLLPFKSLQTSSRMVKYYFDFQGLVCSVDCTAHSSYPPKMSNPIIIAYWMIQNFMINRSSSHWLNYMS